MGADDWPVIKDVVMHLHGRLPLLVDLRQLPGPHDLSVLATNVRTRDGKRPSFAEETGSWFLFPLRDVMVIELPPDVLETPADGAPSPAASQRDGATADDHAAPHEAPENEVDSGPIEPDEDLLARIRDL